MAYNITLLENLSGIFDYIGFINYHSSNMFVIMTIVAIVLLITISQLRFGRGIWESLAISLSLSFLPTLIFRSRTFLDVPLVPDWFVIMLFLSMGICIAIAYNTKTR